MKKFFILLSIILVCSTFICCGKQLVESSREVNTYDKASISNISISDDIISLTFTYSGENQLHLGDWFILEIYENGTWYSLPYDIENAFELEAHPVNPNQSKTLEYNLKYVYKSLSAGNYRIVTKVSDFIEAGNYTDYYLAAEFEIK